MIGRTFAHYEVTELLGKGGMGEVYRAQDRKLGRQVALKFLPPEFARDPERVARFEREARVLASVQHPNIASIYGFESDGDHRFLVMELVEGDDLSRIVAKGPLPQQDALDIARQVIEGLEAAHEKGIVHRDLKSANIRRGPDGQVKILDFGLALPPGSDPDPEDLEISPTVAMDMTRTGVILGTAAYMSPEQARGHAVGRWSDVWAFGVVLYELLTGTQPFRSRTTSDTVAAVLTKEPDWSALPPTTPPAVKRTLRHCLAKNRKHRLHHIADARLELQDVGTEDDVDIAPRTSLPTWSWGLIALAAAAVFFAGSRLGSGDVAVPELPHRQYSIAVPHLSEADWSRPVISPDGTRLAYRIDDQLMTRDLGALEDRMVAGGEGGSAPFWSPDGAWLAFARNAQLWKVPAAGGSPVMLCDLPNRSKLMSGAWSNGGRIAISIWRDAVYELSAQGGVPRVLVQPDSTIGTDFQSLQYLPDGQTLLTTPHPQQDFAVAGVNMGKIMAVRNGEARVLLGDEESLHCHGIAWSRTGHLLYSRAFNNVGIWAIPFSPERLEIRGPPFMVASNGRSPSVAADGSLAYIPNNPDEEYELVWVDRRGEVLDTLGRPARSLRWPSLSPDGKRVAYSARNDGGKRDIYILDPMGLAPIRLTFAEGNWGNPEWSPDGRRLVFDYGTNMATKQADGTGELRRLFPGSGPAFSPDGESVIYHHYQTGKELRDVLIEPIDGSGQPVALVDGPTEERGRLSPEGDYLAYESDESGTDEIYLTRYPDGEGKWQVSIGGGQNMRWVPGGNELIYVDTDGALVSVQLQRNPTLRIAEPVRLFGSEKHPSLDTNRGFDLSLDGRRLLMVRRIPREGSEPLLIVVQNWLAGS